MKHLITYNELIEPSMYNYGNREETELYKKFKNMLRKITNNKSIGILNDNGKLTGFFFVYKTSYNWKVVDKEKDIQKGMEIAKKLFSIFDKGIIKIWEGRKKVSQKLDFGIEVDYEWLKNHEYLLDSEELGLL